MNIEDFKSNFQNGARPTLYQVEILGLPDKLRFMAKTAQLPGKNIGMIDVPYMGQILKVAGDVTYEDLELTITLDKDFSVRTEIEKWMEIIRAPASALGAGNMNLYKTIANVVQLGIDGEELAIYNFIGLFPTVLSPVELGFESVDTIAEYSATFAFDYWLREK